MNAEDAKHLDMLAIFHYVVGGLIALFSCFPFIHVFIGLAVVSGKFFEQGEPPPDAAFGWIFVIVGSFFILAGWTMALLIIIAGRKLKRRRARIFCIVVAAVECMFMPFGTVLGVFTLIVLNRDSVIKGYAPAAT